MAPVVNLNRVRKQKERAAKQQQAAENRALYGRSKKDRRLEAAEQHRAEREFDGKKLD